MRERGRGGKLGTAPQRQRTQWLASSGENKTTKNNRTHLAIFVDRPLSTVCIIGFFTNNQWDLAGGGDNAKVLNPNSRNGYEPTRDLREGAAPYKTRDRES
jgi:hypothetical protein